MATLKPEELLQLRLLYKTLSARGDAQLITENKNQRLSVQINMHKDKDILISLRAMGILEVARAFATPDSLFALNRLNKTAYALSYQQGTKLLQAEMPFSSLENLIAGNSLLPADVPITATTKEDSVLTITQKKENFIQTLRYDLRTQVLSGLQLKATDRPFQCTIAFSDYRKIGIGQSFAYGRTILINNAGKEIKLSISFNQANIDQPVNTDFQIPGSYKILKKVEE